MKVFGVFDKKINAYAFQFFSLSTGQALRDFIDTAKNAESRVAKHPEDYELFEFGVFDEATGIFGLLPQPKCLGLASDLIL